MHPGLCHSLTRGPTMMLHKEPLISVMDGKTTRRFVLNISIALFASYLQKIEKTLC